MEPRSSFPLLKAQKDIWFGHQVDPGAGAYNIAQYTELRGDLNLDCFFAALKAVVLQTEALRLSFHFANGALTQSLEEIEWPGPELHDFSRDADPKCPFGKKLNRMNRM